MAIRISYSKISSYLRCPEQHYLSYVQRLTPRKPIRPLTFGNDFHLCLQYRDNPKKVKKVQKQIAEQFNEMPAKFQEELGEDYVQSIETIFADYQRYYANARLPTITELEFEIPIATCKGEKILFVGKIDELYKLRKKGTKEKFIKIGEHKTFNRQPDMNTLVMNTQIYLYAKAVQFLEGLLPTRVIWDYIKSTPAKEPVWLEKSQRFSTANKNDVTSYSFERACADRGITDKKIVVQAQQYEANLANFFFKVELDIIPNMAEEMWESFLHTCKQIALYGEKNRIRNVTMDCKWCSFRDICHAEFTGGDASYVIAKDYKEKEKRYG